MKKLQIVVLGLVLAASLAQAETARQLDPLVVTATRTETPLSQVASSVTVITAEDIALRQAPTVLELLRGVPGLDLVQTGGVGGQTSVFLRGTDNRHTLVLVDGIEVFDASGVERVADLADITVDNVERIEIIRGPQSVLYGSDAIGGVINIITRRGAEGVHGYAAVEAGSYDTFSERAGLSGGGDWGQASFAISRTDSDGFSAADEDAGNTEEDGYANTSAALRLSLAPTEALTLNTSLRYIHARDDFDNGFPISDARDYYDVSDQFFGRAEVVARPTDVWELALGAALSDQQRDNTEGASQSWFDSTLVKFDLKNQLRLGHHTLVVGAETEEEAAESFSYGSLFDEQSRTTGVYLQDQFVSEGFTATAGVRHDHHDRFGDETTWRLASSYRLAASGTRVKGSVGTGFQAPSLFQLFSSYGNPDLEAEKSLGWDLGVEQPLAADMLRLELTWFQNRIKDFVDYDFATSSYGNIGELRTRGLETALTWRPCHWADLRLSYTYTDTEDRATGARLERRPLHKGGLDASLYPWDAWNLRLNLQYVGERDDIGNVELDEYVLINLSSSYQLTPALRLTGRVDNLFNTDYEEVAGYGVAGLSAYAGLEARF